MKSVVLHQEEKKLKEHRRWQELIKGVKSNLPQEEKDLRKAKSNDTDSELSTKDTRIRRKR